ncbi:HNH endonuclease signature motif containing protein [Sanguibacter keddieii]|nr:HNH endonuclease signature motif containing protein [Sanguibacter keddieii]
MTLAQANTHLGDLFDAVVAGFAEVAAAQARAAERVEELRQWSSVVAEVAARHRGKKCADGIDLGDAERSVVAELGCALRLPERSAGALVSESKALVHEHPATMAALREGQVSYRHAQAVLDATVGLDEPSVLELDALLALKAQTLTVSRLKTVARRERERRDSRPLVERHQVAAQDRHVELHPCGDGMAWLHHLLPAVQATAIFHRLTDIATAVQGPDEPRTLAQLRADASVDLMLDDDARTALTAAPVTSADDSSDDRTVEADTAAQYTAGNPRQSIAGIADRVSLGGIKPQVAVTIPVMTLLGHSDEPGDLAGHGPIDAHTARRLAAQAPSFLRILTHPETGTVLSVGRDRYAVPADLKSWLRIRDETCRFPGCSRRAQRCDIDHVKDWAHGGTTDHHNLIHLCRHHHRLKHTTWTVRTEPVHRPPTQPPDRGSGGRDPDHDDQNDDNHETHETHDHETHEHLAPTADVVRWTAPTGRDYLDHAAQELARRHAVDSGARHTTHVDRGESQFPDDPPF